MEQKSNWILDKANHNKELCLLLHSEPYKFEDRVTTVSFYSALHFVKFKIFPVIMPDIRKEEFKNFDEFTSFMYNKRHSTDSPHEMLKNLVHRHLRCIYSPYHYLLRQSMASRYNEYNANKERGQIALEKLWIIEKECLKN